MNRDEKIGVIMLVAVLISFGVGYEVRVLTGPKSNKNNGSGFPDVFEVYQDGEYFCVKIISINSTLFSSMVSSEAIQWAVDHVIESTNINVSDEVNMRGTVDLGSGDKTYSIYAKEIGLQVVNGS